jgi:methylated-DNA-[protein]-cysteine S-methyltransferase
MFLIHEEFDSPVGMIDLLTHGDAIVSLDFRTHEARMKELLQRYVGAVQVSKATRRSDALARLEDYFEGDLAAIESLSVQRLGTPFQQKVWAALRTIRAGTIATYQQIAEQIGSPKACRAVGMANGSNPIAIVVPCHRVIGANQTLTGYGGGLDRKHWLLAHEGVTLSATPSRRAVLQVA